MNDRRLRAPAAARNRDPIAAVLREVLPVRGTVLEIASGSGEHAAWFAGAFPELVWQPSDPDRDALESVAAWRDESRAPNLLPPVLLDASADTWPVRSADAILCINMVHISPWKATLGLLRGAARLLPPGGPLILYGPYRRAGVPTAPSNEDFDRSLKARDPSWGLRDLEDLVAAAELQELGFDRLFEMPANNVTLIFRRA
jgi:SAM-dependent methyltransferase